MATNQSPLVVGVFQSEAQAKSAIDALRTAGFGYDQVGVATREGGAVAPNLLNDLANLGVPQEYASYYDNEFKAGRTVVSVRPDGRDQEAMNILRSNGAYDYDTRGSATQTGAYGQTDYRTAGTVTTAQAGDYVQSGTTNYVQTGAQPTDYADTDENRALRLREEQLSVDKQRVQTGEVGLRKEVVTEQKSVDVPVTHEEVYVERRAVSGGQVDDTPIGQDEVIRVPVSEEQLNVTKTPVVTGEVSIGKRAVQENQQVSDTVRREEARIERQGDVNIGDTNTTTDTTNRNI